MAAEVANGLNEDGSAGAVGGEVNFASSFVGLPKPQLGAGLVAEEALKSEVGQAKEGIFF